MKKRVLSALFCILFTAKTLLAVPLAEQWVVNVKRLTNDDYDNYLGGVSVYNDTASFDFWSYSGYDTHVDVNTNYNTPRSTLNLPGMNVSTVMEYDDSVNIYMANGSEFGDLFVKTDSGVQQLNRTGLGETCKIIAVSDGVAVYQNDDGINFAWRDGQTYQLPSNESNNTSNVVSVENGIIAYTEHYDQARVWQWVDGENGDPGEAVTTALATANSYEAETIIGMKDGVVVFGDQNGNTYVWQNGNQEGLSSGAPNNNEYITGMAGGIVTFTNDDGDSFVWQNGASYALSSAPYTDEKVVAIDNGVVAYTDENGESYMWRLEDDGNGGLEPVKYTISTSANEPEKIIAMKNGLAVIETADKQAYVWEDGHTYAISASTNRDENIIGIGDGIVGIEDSNGYAWVWNSETKTTTALSSDSPYNVEHIIGVDGKIIVFETADEQTYVWYDGETDALSGTPYVKEHVVAFDYGMIAFQDEDGNAYVWRDGEQYPLPSNHAYSDELIVGMAENMVVFKDDMGELYAWRYNTDDNTTQTDGMPGHPGYDEQIIDVSEDGKIAWKEYYNNETRVYIWQDGVNTLVDHGDDFQTSGFINGEFYYTMNTNRDAYANQIDLYKYSQIDEEPVKIDENVDYVNSSLDGRIYYNKVVQDGDGYDHYEKWAMWDNSSPTLVNDVAYQQVGTNKYVGYDSVDNTLYGQNYYGDYEVIDEFTSGFDKIYIPASGYDGNFYWEYSQRSYGWYDSDSHTPKLDKVTNEVAWDKFYRAQEMDTYSYHWDYDYDTGEYIKIMDTPNSSHGGSTVYWSHNENEYTKPVDNDTAEELTDPQYRALAANKGVVVSVGYTSESLSKWPSQFNYEQRLNDTEYIHFNDGSSMPVSIFYDQIFESEEWSYENEYWGGLTVDPVALYALSEQHFALLFKGVYEGETDSEYIMVWLNPADPTYSGTPTDPEDPGDPGDPGDPISVPEPTTLLLSGLALALTMLRKKLRR